MLLLVVCALKSSQWEAFEVSFKLHFSQINEIKFWIELRYRDFIYNKCHLKGNGKYLFLSSSRPGNCRKNHDFSAKLVLIFLFHIMEVDFTCKKPPKLIFLELFLATGTDLTNKNFPRGSFLKLILYLVQHSSSISRKCVTNIL